MKIQLYHYQEWNYDELEKDIITLYSTPDDFKFDLDVLEEFFDFKGYAYKIMGEEYYYIQVNFPNEKRPRDLMPYNFLDEPTNEKDLILNKEFIEWLKTKNVYVVEYEHI